MKQILVIAGLLFGYWGAFAQLTVTRGPYLQRPTDSGMIIRWRTDAAGDSKVSYGTSPSALNQVASLASAVTDHRVEITGLQPNTTYYYRIESNNQVLAGGDSLHRFHTAPIPGTVQPIRAWVIGDFGKASQGQQDVRDSYLNFEADTHTDLWLWLGDNVYENGTDQEYTDKVFHPVYGYPTIFPRLPFLPTPGNHDYLSIQPPTSNINPGQHSGPYYEMVDVPFNGELGGTPSGMPAFYSYDWGNAHFVSANSEIGTLFGSANDWIGVYPLFNIFASPFSSSPFTQWLHNDLGSTDKRWKIVYFHQPPYTDGSHESGTFWEVYMEAMKKNIIPILEQYDVDLVLCGHSHVYERSFLIKGHYDDPNTWNAATMLVDGRSGTDSLGEAYVKDYSVTNGTDGTVYAVVGNSGSKDDNPNLQYPAHYFGEGCDTCYGSMVLDIHGDTLRGRYLRANGQIGDDFTILKRNGPTMAEDVSEIGSLSVSPNPTQGSFSVMLGLVRPCTVSLSFSDLEGRDLGVIKQFVGMQGNQTVQAEFPAQLASGTYMLHVRAGDSKQNVKVVLRR
jgi:hypothetical protein